MKKLIIAIAVTGLVALSSHAQGLVLFTSSTQAQSTNNTLAQLGNTASGRLSPANNYYFALFYSTTITSGSAMQGGAGANSTYLGSEGYAFANAGWTLVTQTIATNTGVAGRFSAAGPNADGSTTVNGLASGSSANFVIVGWSANLGNSITALEAALATPGTFGFLGESSVSGSITAGNGGTIPTPALMGSLSPTIGAFTLGSFQTVPEPTTLALAAMGVSSLLLFRRKK